MDSERTLLSIINTYLDAGLVKPDSAELELWKELLKDSTERLAYRVFNNGHEYDTRKEYFL